MADLEKFPPPSDKKTFIMYWEKFLPDIEDRDNLKPSHLYQLRVLCDLCVQYDELYEIIDLEGRTYWSEGRNGRQQKPTVEVQLMAKTVVEIRNYSKMLGLVLVKDTKTTREEEDNEFA